MPFKIHPLDLAYACRVGDLKIIKRFLSLDSDINTPIDSSGSRLLHKAASHGCLEVAQYLITNGADMYIPNLIGYLPIHKAIISGKAKLVNILIENGQDVNSCQGGLPLQLAVALEKIEIVKLLIVNGAKTHLKGLDDSVTAFELAKAKATREGNFEIYEILKKTHEENQYMSTTPPQIITTKFDNCIGCEQDRKGELFALVPCLHANMCRICCKKILKETNPRCPSCRTELQCFQKVYY